MFLWINYGIVIIVGSLNFQILLWYTSMYLQLHDLQHCSDHMLFDWYYQPIHSGILSTCYKYLLDAIFEWNFIIWVKFVFAILVTFSVIFHSDVWCIMHQENDQIALGQPYPQRYVLDVWCYMHHEDFVVKCFGAILRLFSDVDACSIRRRTTDHNIGLFLHYRHDTRETLHILSDVWC
jgi:hypothetical protein